MSTQGRLTMAKRDRERQAAERRRRKTQERAEGRQRPTTSAAPRTDGSDPDIAHIVAGPQAPHDWQREDSES